MVEEAGGHGTKDDLAYGAGPIVLVFAVILGVVPWLWPM